MYFHNLEVIGVLNHLFCFRTKTLLKNHLLMQILKLTEILILALSTRGYHTEEVLMEQNISTETRSAVKSYNTLHRLLVLNTTTLCLPTPILIKPIRLYLTMEGTISSH